MGKNKVKMCMCGCSRRKTGAGAAEGKKNYYKEKQVCEKSFFFSGILSFSPFCLVVGYCFVGTW